MIAVNLKQFNDLLLDLESSDLFDESASVEDYDAVLQLTDWIEKVGMQRKGFKLVARGRAAVPKYPVKRRKAAKK